MVGRVDAIYSYDDTFFWERMTDYVYPEGNDGWSWAIATTDVCAHRRAITLKERFRFLSTQDVINSFHPYDSQLKEQSVDRALEHVFHNKISMANDCTYKGKKVMFDYRDEEKDNRATSIDGYICFDVPSREIVETMLLTGPVIVSTKVDATFTGKDLFKRVPDWSSKDVWSHTLSLIGEGEGGDPGDGHSAWIVKNSKGRSWGDQGIGKLASTTKFIQAGIPLFNTDGDRDLLYKLARMIGIEDPPMYDDKKLVKEFNRQKVYMEFSADYWKKAKDVV